MSRRIYIYTHTHIWKEKKGKRPGSNWLGKEEIANAMVIQLDYTPDLWAL